jgi:hypothetical protein
MAVPPTASTAPTMADASSSNRDKAGPCRASSATRVDSLAVDWTLSPAALSLLTASAGAEGDSQICQTASLSKSGSSRCR